MSYFHAAENMHLICEVVLCYQAVRIHLIANMSYLHAVNNVYLTCGVVSLSGDVHPPHYIHEVQYFHATDNMHLTYVS